MSYYDCALIPVPTGKLDAYKAFSAHVAAVYREYGAVSVIDCLLDRDTAYDASFHAEGARETLDDDALRDFSTAADARDGEVVILSWTEWPDKPTRDEGTRRALADPRIQPKPGEEVIFEGQRLIAGSFTPLLKI
jgi:uncharacterized protein YbaA (DUF1428 family)